MWDPHHKLKRLIMLTIAMARGQLANVETLEALVGSWSVTFMFSRPLYSLFSLVCRLGPVSGHRQEPFRRPAAARNELLLAAVLGTCALTS